MHTLIRIESGANDVQMVGKARMCTLSDDEVYQINLLLASCDLPPLANSTGLIHHKAIINGKVFFSVNNESKEA